MKNRFLFLVGIGALLAMSSCSKDEENLVVKSGEPATLKLTLKGTDVNTRALGSPISPTQTEENKIQRIVVGLFKTDGSTDVIFEKEYTSGYTAGTPIEITGRIVQGSGDSGSRDIIVVANAPANHFRGITTKGAFEGKELDLTQTKDLLPMTGTSTVTLQANKTVSPAVNPIPITRLVSRIDLISLTTAFEPGGQYANATFHADEIYLYNAMSKCGVDGASSTLIHGWLNATPPTVVTGLYDTVDLLGSLSSPINYPTTLGDFHFFYTFPNLFPTIIDEPFLNGQFTGYTRLVITGIFKANGTGDGERVYYPIIINRVGTTAELNTSTGVGIGVKRNTVYQVAAIIKNKGVDNPDIVINPAYLNITVTPVNWDVLLPQTVTF